jgi:hypothetical protein
MCKECNYRIREELKEHLNDDPRLCFIQQGLHSTNPDLVQTTNFVVRATLQDRPILEIARRLHNGLGGDIEANRRLAYEHILGAIGGIKETVNVGEEAETFGGLFE